jgi:hypothetical protein
VVEELLDMDDFTSPESLAKLEAAATCVPHIGAQERGHSRFRMALHAFQTWVPEFVDAFSKFEHSEVRRRASKHRFLVGNLGSTKERVHKVSDKKTQATVAAPDAESNKRL